jgi:hypothetical protein
MRRGAPCAVVYNLPRGGAAVFCGCMSEEQEMSRLGDTDAQERERNLDKATDHDAARAKPAPSEHYCHCGRWGLFGYGVSLREEKPGVWFCSEHRPEKA